MHIAVPMPGDVVWIRQRRWRVERARRDRHVVRLDVRNRDERLTFLAPFDKPAAMDRVGKLTRVRPARAAARLAHAIGRSFTVSTIAAAVEAAIDIHAYQLEPALALLRGARRVLLADEVGLGKTIQAGIAIADLHRRTPQARTLVLVPSPLRDQWIDELRTRFGLECRTADRHGLDELARQLAYGDNPWCRPGVWIASLDYVKQHHVVNDLPNDAWHLVVIDEAHVAAGDSERHHACDELARRSRHVLLLTATPHSGDEIRFRHLLDLGRLEGGEAPIVLLRRTRADAGLVLPRRVRWHRVRPTPQELAVFQALADFEAAALRAAGPARRDEAILLLSVFRKRAVSTMRALRVSLDRRLAWLGDGPRDDSFDWLQPRLEFDDDADEMDETDRSSMAGDIGLRGAAERSWLRRLRALAGAAERHDSKTSRITSLIARAREPVVVFTEFRHSLEVLRRAVPAGAAFAELHGGLTPVERRQQLTRFLDGTASVLLATDVGGQGLNLQDRARWVISLELPWNPLKLEQRCGRVDRIGQMRPVHFTLAVARHAFEDGVLAGLARRTLIARRALGDEALSRAVPPAAAVSAALFEDAAIEEAVTLPVPAPICRKFARPARQQARVLTSSRVMTGHWRAPVFDRSTPFWTPIERLASIARAANHQSLLVCSVPLIDGSGSVVEQHAVAICVAGQVDPEVIDASLARAAETLNARSRRLRVRLAREFTRRMIVETEILARLASDLSPDEGQPGLFDQRELRAFETARGEAEDLRRILETRRVDWLRQSEVSVGHPSLEVALLTRR
jgi:superfamily II DNA or RNA helicase